MSSLELVGRSSSHFTRVARIFACELGTPYRFRPVLDLASLDPGNYAENPALKIPILVDEHGPLFGTENICRELTRRSGRAGVLLRGDSKSRLVANAEELTLHVMNAEVALILGKAHAQATGASAVPLPKLAPSLENSLTFLDQNLEAILQALPAERALSFLEVALYAVITHLPFRKVLDVTPWERLGSFAKEFGERESARSTEYHFD